MAKHNSLNVKRSNLQLNKSKSRIKNDIDITVIENSNDENSFWHNY